MRPLTERARPKPHSAVEPHRRLHDYEEDYDHGDHSIFSAGHRPADGVRRQPRQHDHGEPQRGRSLLVNGGAVAVTGGTPTVANTSLIQVFGQGGNDAITLDEAEWRAARARTSSAAPATTS